MSKRWISVRECAEYLGLHEQTISSLCNRGAIPSVKLAGSRRIDVRRLDELLEANTTLDHYEAEKLRERLAR